MRRAIFCGDFDSELIYGRKSESKMNSEKFYDFSSGLYKAVFICK